MKKTMTMLTCDPMMGIDEQRLQVIVETVNEETILDVVNYFHNRQDYSEKFCHKIKIYEDEITFFDSLEGEFFELKITKIPVL